MSRLICVFVDRIKGFGDLLSIIAARTLDVPPHVEGFFDFEAHFLGIVDSSSRPNSEVTVEHSMAPSDDNRSVRHFTTNLSEPLPSGIVISLGSGSSPYIPAKWERSIDAVTLASHVNEYSSRPLLNAGGQEDYLMRICDGA